ncbi:MAG: YceI family protein [Candidatus Hydrogenedentes bacterium]|nr:YceI family protein [Candidatus Hydrogenedentota bacterium]
MMNRTLLRSILSLAALTLTVASTAMAADTYKVDPVHSSAQFRIRHLGVSNVTGHFTEFSGEVTLDAADATKNAVQMEIKTASIDTDNEARDKHLESADFFNVEKFPAMTFKSTSFKKSGDATFDVKGDFTLLGVTKPVTVSVEQVGTGKDKDGNALVGFETTFTIKRSDYGMTKMVGASLIGDEVKITVAVECGKK